MTAPEHPRELSVTEAADIVVTRRNRPVAVVVSMNRIEQIDRMLDELHDLTLAMSRVATEDGDRISFDDVLSAYGLTRADLDAIDDTVRGLERLDFSATVTSTR